jgi:hypothetical protein
MVFRWNKDKENHVRQYYNDKVKISPAILAYKLKVPLRTLVNKMRDLKIRNKREHEKDW